MPEMNARALFQMATTPMGERLSRILQHLHGGTRTFCTVVMMVDPSCRTAATMLGNTHADAVLHTPHCSYRLLQPTSKGNVQAAFNVQDRPGAVAASGPQTQAPLLEVETGLTILSNVQTCRPSTGQALSPHAGPQARALLLEDANSFSGHNCYWNLMRNTGQVLSPARGPADTGAAAGHHISLTARTGFCRCCGCGSAGVSWHRPHCPDIL